MAHAAARVRSQGERGHARGYRSRAAAAAALLVLVIAACCIPANSFFRNERGELIGKTPLVDSIVVLIALLFFIPGVAYGKTVGTRIPHQLKTGI
ncbi:MAG: AbgT family transporter [Clostridia bacterium]|nr:AbgT family transporter [Clostridia bacterium]